MYNNALRNRNSMAKASDPAEPNTPTPSSSMYSSSPPDEHSKCTSILDSEILLSPDTQT